jgi:TonB-dependent Receptor Plug Domain
VRALWVIVLALCALTSRVLAQGSDSTTRSLRVRDMQGRPIDGALVEVGDTVARQRARTPANGLVAFKRAAGEREVALRVSRVGFAPYDDVISWPDASDTTVVRLSEVQALTGMDVRADRAIVDRLGAVDARIARGVPSASVTRADIERRRPIALSQLLRGMTGIRVGDSSGTTVAISTRGAKFVRGRLVDCILRISIDGVIVSSTTSLDQVVPVDVHAIEIYFGPSRIPPDMAGMRGGAQCGLIAIWTRSG